MNVQIRAPFAGARNPSFSSVDGCAQTTSCDKARPFGAVAACGVIMLAGLLVPGIAAANDEVEQLRRQLEDIQQRIEQLERAPERQQLEGAPERPVVWTSEEPVAAAPAGKEGFVSQDASGNDPRDFSSKFMPYYRYMELENDVEVNSFTAFGFFAFNNRFGMTYELPLAQEIDYSDTDEFKSRDPGTLPPAGPLPGAPGGLPFNELERDGNVTGLGDLGLRFFLRPQQLEFSFMEGTKNFSIMPLVEFTVPTATDDLLGGEALIMSPGFALVFDLPARKPPLSLGFIAMMNFYDFDAFKDNDRNYTSKYRGRWFYMQPLSKPAFMKNPKDKSFHIFDTTGFYMLPELQPVYDFREKDFSLWFAPEFGKILREGTIVYAKPGWGIDNSEDGDRDFTFEVGFRYFFE